MDPVLALAIPGGAIAFGVICLAISRFSSRRFDNKYPHLSRNGMRALERERAQHPSARLPASFLPWVPQRPSHDIEHEIVAESGRTDAVMARYRRNVAADLERRKADEQSAA